MTDCCTQVSEAYEKTCFMSCLLTLKSFLESLVSGTFFQQ